MKHSKKYSVSFRNMVYVWEMILKKDFPKYGKNKMFCKM